MPESSTQMMTVVNESRQTNEPTVRLVYIDEGIRVVTIAYQLYQGNIKKNIKFAASIFRKQSDKEVFVRKQHSHTACERLIVRPLWTRVSIPEEVSHFDRAFYEDLKHHLRKEVHKRGTGSKQRLTKAEVSRPSATHVASAGARLALGSYDHTPPAYFGTGAAHVAVRA